MHDSKTNRHHADILEEICLLVKETMTYLKQKPSGTVEEHITTLIWLDHSTSIGYKTYTGIYLLVPTPSTFTITVPGLLPFTFSPAAGEYVRWNYPEGTTIQLVSPINNSSYAVDFLYTYDTSTK